MARHRWIYEGGEVVAEYKDDALLWSKQPEEKKDTSAYVMPDIQPYKSMVDGSEITSRSVHRSHLRQHNLVEVGNETKYLKQKPVTPPPGLKQTLIEVAREKLRYR